MRLDRNQSTIQLLTAFAFTAALWLLATAAHAAGPAESSASELTDQRVTSYEVKQGDSLSGIAVAHGMDLASLMEANGIENPDRIRSGMTIVLPVNTENGVITKRGVLLTVPKGITLSRIAELYGLPVKTIARANRLANPNALRAGQKLLVPGAERAIELVPPPPCYKDPVTLFRVRTDETRTVPLCFCDGRPNPAAVEILSALSGPVGVDGAPLLEPRVAQLLQKVAERFPGKRLELISGFRPGKQPDRESFHNKGQAIDFRVEGVSNKKLAFFVRGFDTVGVGFYPNSVFIHMDSRDRSAWWIDYSKPGEKAIYGRADMTDDEVEAVRARRASAVGEASAPAAAVAGTEIGNDTENQPVEPSPAA
ncbi:MAG TPA: LysM peptidoglycan-binding domain-containing protein [Polyangia bacterium]|nr:LysM peptidoglycan-binding domain-containing protein [Polyangia bacterium]